MVDEKTLIKFGLNKDINNLKLKEVFKNNIKLKEIHIDLYPENPLVTSKSPFMLLLRTIEKNAIVSNNEDRIILKRNDSCNTFFVNMLLSEVSECYYKNDFNNYYEFIIKIQNNKTSSNKNYSNHLLHCATKLSFQGEFFILFIVWLVSITQNLSLFLSYITSLYNLQVFTIFYILQGIILSSYL